MRLYSKFLKIYVFFLLFALPLAFIQKCEEAYYLPKIALLLTALQYGYMALRKIKFDVVDKALGAFLLLFSAGYIKSGFTGTAVTAGLSWLASACLYLYMKYGIEYRERKKAVLCMLASALLASGYAVAQAFRLDMQGWLTDFSGRSFSSVGNPDFLGGFLVLVVPLCALLYSRFGLKAASAAVFVFLLFSLSLTQTRSSIAAALVMLAAMIMYFRDFFARNARVLAVAVVAAVIALALSGRAGALAGRFTGTQSGDGSLSGRVAMWKAGLKMAAANPLTGTGIGNIRKDFPLYAGRGSYFETADLHNDFVQAAAESGVAAGLALVFFMASSFAAMIRVKTPESGAAFAALCGFMTHAFFNFPLQVMDTKIYFFAILALGTGTGGREEPGKDSVLASAAASAALVAALLAVCGGIFLNYGINGKSSGKKDAGTALLQAVRLYPGPKKYYYAADWCQMNGDLKKAGEYSAKFLEKLPLSKQGMNQAGIIAAESGNTGGAEAVFRKFLKYYPDDLETGNNLGKTLFMSGRQAESLAVYEELVKKHPGDELAHNSLHAVYLSAGMKKQAEQEMVRWKAVQKPGLAGQKP